MGNNSRRDPRHCLGWCILAVIWLVSGQPALSAEPEHPIFRSIRERDDQLLDLVLQRGTPVDVRSPDETTPLIYAALHGTTRSIQLLLQHGADPNAQNDQGVTALVRAAVDREKVKLLLEHGAEVNHKTRQGNSPLLVAAAVPGNGDVILMLVDHGANLVATNGRGWSPLDRILLARDLENFRVLTKVLEDSGQLQVALQHETARLIRNAAEMETPEPLRFLLGKLQQHNLPTPGLQSAVYRSLLVHRPANVALLMEHQVDVNRTQGSGNVPFLTLATYSDSDDDSLIQLLLSHGADPTSTNTLGETALTWAQRRGHPGMIAALKAAGTPEPADPAPTVPQHEIKLDQAGAQETLRESVSRSLELMSKSSDKFLQERRRCVSCHHQDLPSVAFAWARDRGIAIDEQAISRIVARRNAITPANFERAYQLERFVPVPPRLLGWNLWGLSALGQPRDEWIEASVWYLMQTQSADGRWTTGFERPPMGGSDILATALAVQAIRLYPPLKRETEVDATIEAAANWLESAEPQTLQDRVARLLGLSLSGLPVSSLRDERERILGLQRSDGGWAQLPQLESDAWATGQTLTVLAMAGVLEPDSVEYRRGLQFLLTTEFDDGAWFVKRRAFPFQEEFDSDFPFGHDQWISIGGTTWATMAMLLAIEPKSPGVVSRVGDPSLLAHAEAKTTRPKASNAPEVGAVEFTRDIRPILQTSCVGCHRGEEPAGGFRMQDRQDLLRGGDTEQPAIIPGDPTNSLIVELVSGEVDGLAMPPVEERDEYPALTPVQIAKLRKWIEQDAPWPNDSSPTTVGDDAGK